MLLFNLKKAGWMQNSRLREVLCSAIDRQKLLEMIGSEDLSPAAGILAGGETKQEPLLPEKAAALLQEAGYDGEALQLFTYTFQQNEQEACWLAQTWERLGIKVEVTILPVHEFGSTHYLEKADLILCYQVMDENRELFLHEMYLSPRSIMRRYLSPQASEQIDSQAHIIMQEESAEKRFAHLLALEEQIKQELAIYFVYHRHERATYHPALSGVTLNALGWVQFKDVWFQSKKDER